MCLISQQINVLLVNGLRLAPNCSICECVFFSITYTFIHVMGNHTIKGIGVQLFCIFHWKCIFSRKLSAFSGKSYWLCCFVGEVQKKNWDPCPPCSIHLHVLLAALQRVMSEKNWNIVKFLDHNETIFCDIHCSCKRLIASCTPRRLEWMCSMPLPLRMKKRTHCGLVTFLVVCLPSGYSSLLYFLHVGSIFVLWVGGAKEPGSLSVFA